MQLIKQNSSALQKNKIIQVLIIKLGNQLFGLPVHLINDVLAPQYVHPIPLADKIVAGNLNLRGRIVTAMDLRVILNVETLKEQKLCMSVVTEDKGELYSLIVDGVDEVINILEADIKTVPSNLEQSWKDLSLGVHQSNDRIIIIIDMKKLIDSFSLIE